MENAPHDRTEATPLELDASLRSASFVGLLFTQLLTAINDNVFRWLAIGVGKDFVDPGDVGKVLMAGTACFVLPYLLLAAPAGYLADRFSKRTVIFYCKVAEIVIMALGMLAIVLGSLWGIFLIVAFMGAQSALFSPAKMGSIPEMLRAEKISAANGLFGLTTVSATVIGMAVGSGLSDLTGFKGQENWWMSAAVLLGIAFAGLLFSLLIRRLPMADPHRVLPWNVPRETARNLLELYRHPPLFRVALGIVFFWSVGALAQLNIDQFAFEGGATAESDKTPLLIALVLGVGLGSVLAGVWSRGRVELGILPLGAFGVAGSSCLLFLVQGTIIDPASAWTAGFVMACILLLMLGVSAGLFSVPLEAFMQHRSPRATRGSILAAANFLTFTGVLLSALLFAGLRLPVFDGDLDNIPAHLRGGELNAPQVELADQLEARYRETLAAVERGEEEPARQALTEATSPATLEQLLEEAGEEVGEQAGELGPGSRSTDEAWRAAALTRLLAVALETRKEASLALETAEYKQQFAGQQMLIAAVARQVEGLPLFSARQIFLVAGGLTIPVFLYILLLIPQASIRFVVWLVSSTVYRIKVHDRENLPAEGGALLVANHISWLDGALLMLTSSRPIRMVVWAGNFEKGWLRWLGNLFGIIPISPRPKAIVAALREAREALQNGELVCIFPEGGISRTGQIQAFRPGLLRVLEGTDAPVIPVYLDGLWGSIFSFEGGKFFWKLPRKWPYPISIFFGPPVEPGTDLHRIRRSVQDLGALAVEQRRSENRALSADFIRVCKKRKRRGKIADSTGAELTGGSLLMRALILRRLLRRHILKDEEQVVGVLLPPSNGGFIVNAALALDRRVAVNLNYTVSSDVMNNCIEQAGIRHVLTSEKFMEKMNFQLDAEVTMLEQLRDKPTLGDKLTAAVSAYATPARLLIRQLGLQKVKGEDLLTIIFTSGSTGTPKGVMLTHANISSNTQAVDQIVHLTSEDVVVGILPFFHSFGYTVTLWTVGSINVKGVYHFSPLDPRQVGKLVEKHGATILLATPTFLRGYLRKCSKEEFATLDVVVAGAEKLPVELCDAFEEKFGVRPVEGYGTTELSPLVSVNIPPSRSAGNFQVDCKEGTVGRPIPNVSAKVVDPETGEELSAGQAGMLLIRGPNVMKGYLHRQDLTDEVMRDGWYVTGDIALIDDEGFIQITGRESRFSKIGGEMIPHIKIEETINQLLGVNEEEGQKAVVTAVPHARKGERLVVVHLPLDRKPEDICSAMRQAGLPNLFIPSKEAFLEVEELPLLGSGKLDLKQLKQLAEEAFGEDKA